MIGTFCIVRTRSAGIHMGVLAECAGTAVVLTDARRLWNWTGANTLHEIALRGVGEKSRISEAVPRILLTETIEVIPCTEQARKNLTRSRWN